jgi:hypothetical protein
VPARVRQPHEPLGGWWIVLGALLCVGYGVLVGQWAPASFGVVVATAVPGLLILPLAWRVGPPHRNSRPGPAKWVWAVVMVLLCLWQLTSFLFQPDPRTASHDHPTISAILRPVFESPTVRAVVLAVWLAFGLWLARRLSIASRQEP